MGLQTLENKVLSRGIIGKSAPLLAEISIRKSQDPEERRSGAANERYLSVGVGGPTLEHYVAPQQLPQDVRLQAVDTGYVRSTCNFSRLRICP